MLKVRFFSAITQRIEFLLVMHHNSSLALITGDGLGKTKVLCMLISLIICVIIFQFRYNGMHSSHDNSDSVVLEKQQCKGTVQRIGDGIGEDGGWFLCTPSSWEKGSSCVVYSFGIKDNFSFDKAVINMGCTVHGFDPSPYGLVSKPAYEELGGKYHSYGLGGRDAFYGPGQVPFNWPGLGYLKATNTAEWELKSLPTIMRELHNGNRAEIEAASTHIILKVDVEGAEWDAMEDLVHANWNQLLIEMHFTPQYFKFTKLASGGVEISRVYHNAFIDAAQSVYDKPVLPPPRYNYIEGLKRLNAVAEMWQWNFNGKHCIEAYFTRRGMLTL